MAKSVTHIMETMPPEAGGVFCTLPGLFEFQKRKGWKVEVVSRENLDQADTAVGAADLVHVHGTAGRTIQQLWPLLKRTRKPYLLSTYATKMPRPHRYGGRSWAHRLKQGWASFGYAGGLLRKARCLHALSEREADRLRRRRGIQRVKVLPMGIDLCPPDSEPNGLPDPICEGKRMLLFLGPLHPGEGLGPFLRACALVAERFEDLHLVLAGRQELPWTEMLSAAIRRQRFEDRVTLIRSPQPEQMQQLLHETDLVVAPIIGECCPVGPLQALACGKPVLISPGCNLPEVQLRQAGWIVEPKRRQLQSVLHEVFSRSRSDLQKMGQRGMGVIKERYIWDRLGHEYLNLYAKVLS